MKRKNIIKNLTITFLAGTLIFTSCAKKIDDNTSTTEEKTTVLETTTVAKELRPAKGGMLNLAMNKPISLNILDNQIRDVADVLSLVYEPLFILNENEKPVGVLAKSYEYDESGRGLVINLRDDISFHNGEPLTAADVKFTVDYIKTHPDSPYNFYALPIKRVSIVDDFVVKFFYDEPYAYAVSDLIFPIVSADYMLSAEYDENRPVGTGPYMYKDFQSTSHLELARFDGYREDIYIDGVKATIVNSTADIENMFKAGLIDVYAPVKFNWLDYMGKSDMEVYEYCSRNLTFIGFNFEKKDVLTKEVRTNILKSIDRQSISHKLFADKVEITDSPILPGAYFNVQEADFDLDSQAEVVSSEENKLKLKMLVNASSENNLKLANALANDLGKINIELENVSLEKAEYFKALNSGNFDLYLANVRLSSRPDYYALFHSKGSQNFGKYNNPIMDEYIEKLINATSEEAIIAGADLIENQFLTDLPYATLFFHRGGVMLSPNVKGNYKIYKDNILYSVRDLYMDEE